MVKNYILAGGFAVICGGAVASAQSTTPQQPPQTQPPAAMSHDANTTVEGCVYREADIPGRSPNVAERAGVLEDYILVASADTKSGTVGTSGTTGATGTSTAKARMFKLEHADDSKLSAMVGKRVKVTGKAEMDHRDMKAPAAPRTTTPPATNPPATTPQADRSMGPDKIELPEFEVASITEATGTCPSKPEIKK